VEGVGDLAREEADADLADDEDRAQNAHHVEREVVFLLDEGEHSQNADFPSLAQEVADGESCGVPEEAFGAFPADGQGAGERER
jgi:hypothetical protein